MHIVSFLLSVCGFIVISIHMTEGQMNMGMNNTNMDMGNGGMDHNNMGSMMMKMYFYFSTNETLLFKEWVTYNDKTMGLACLYVLLVAVFYEGLKVFRGHLYKLERRKTLAFTCMGFLFHIIQTILHMIQVFISLCLMLVFMTFNVYLCITVVAGAGLGYLFFGWNRSKSGDDNEHCY